MELRLRSASKGNSAARGIRDSKAERWAPVLADNPDMPEGVAAFAERRTPEFVWVPEETS
jgi:hypothetical protein